NGEAVFYAGDSSKSFTVDIPPPSSPTTYQISIHVEGYAASPVAIPVDSNGGDAGTIVLTKASILTGSVLLPAAITEWKNIDVQAINVTDSEDRYWGWGNIDPSQGPTDTGTFQIDGVPVGTFDLEIRVWGYAVSILEDVIIVQGQDKDVGQIAVSEGSKITGILTVQGDTTNLMRWEGDTEDPMNVWIDAWSPSAGWGGTNVQVPRGLNQSVGYTIGGLADGTYEVHSWIGEGYELVDDNGNVPVIVSVIDTANQDVVLKPNEGIVQGTITGPGTLDLNKVVVEVKRPWDWLPPKLATVANGGIQTAGATFAVNGFGTGDYIVKAGMYDGFIDFDGNPRPLSEYQGAGWLVPNGAVGISMQRVFVENNATRPTTCNINFQAGYAIAGTL
ncbi:MAG: hypothetical protein GTO14_00805, partial [Anaerolineales bacterium]|nr:hypothetical protein [Anaerolineales bacterium]